MPITQIEHDYSQDERLISETNLKGIITTANASFCEVSGFSLEELVGKPHNIVRHPDVPPEVFADMWRTIQAGERWVGVVKNRCKNGNHYWVRAFVSPIVRDGQIVGYRSVRVKPSREEIQEAERLYQSIRDRGVPVLDTLGDLHLREPWTARLPIERQVALVAAWPLLGMLSVLAAALVGVRRDIVLALVALVVLTTLAIARSVGTRLKGPLHELRRLAMALERGDLTARLNVHGHSELAQMARELNRALDGMELLVSEIAQVLSAMARGDLGRRVLVTLPGELERVKKAVNEAADQMETTLEDVTTRLSALANGQFHAVGQSSFTAKGKFQEVHRHTELATERLLELLTELMETTQAMASGDLTRAIEVGGVGDLQAFYEQMNATQVNLRQALQEIRERTHVVAAASRELTAASEGIAAGAEKQTRAIEEVRRSLHEAASAVIQVAEDARTASLRSEEAVAVVQSGKEKMDRMVHAVRSIEKRSHEVSGITSLIEEVAEQTNLLALNAAIEAARAGESGKGFAVVADEVRKLASRVSDSTQDIRSLVDEAIAAARQAYAEAADVAAGMDDIESSVQATDELLRQVADVLQAQTATLLKAGQDTESFSEIAEANATATVQLAGLAEELLETAGAVHERVHRFRVEARE